MNIQLVFMKSPSDGFCVAEHFDVDTLPRVGERVFLPTRHCNEIIKHFPASGFFGVPRRFDVVGVEHRWDDLGQTPHVQISSINNPEFNRKAIS